jgi:pyruvate kinase
LRPRRDALGRVLTPARIWLTTAEDPSDAQEPGMPTLPLPREWLGRRSTGDVVHLRDARGATRRLLLTGSDATGGRCDFVGTVDKTTYLATGLPLHVAGDVVAVPDLPAVSQALMLGHGDTLELTRDCAPAPVQTGGTARIGATLPELFDDARVGDPILFDDGKLGGEIVAVTDDALTVRIDQPARGTVKLREAKGINVPETPLQVSALTAKDVVDLRTVADVADVVELSFVRSADDVERLLAELDRLSDDRLGVVLKIETRQAFENLPQLLLAAMRRARVGVMVARGDLAVECGFERMAELQEEILWLCEAAHLPVVWATQVLEQCVQTGLPSRAEISDAAMSERAECVMLNKGPFVDDAVSVLDDVLRRMAAHHYKKTVLLRSLRSWHTPGPTVG